MNDAAPAVALGGVAKRFGWTWALQHVTLTLPRHTTMALVGPNGAGKTTLLKLIATLISPTSGEGEVLGFELGGRDGDEIRSRTGLLTVRGYLYDDLSADENLRFAARMAGDSVDPDRIESVLERVGLAGIGTRKVRAFSTGMRKRLALAKLLLRDLELILMDEPYAGLDTEGIALVDDVVVGLRGAGATVIIASHQDGQAVLDAELRGEIVKGRLEI